MRSLCRSMTCVLALLWADAAFAAPSNDTCAGAIFLSCGNINVSGSTSTAHNDYTFTDTLNSCTGHSAAGKDVVYAVKVGVGDSLWLDYRSIADGSIYVVRDCSNIDGTCVAGSDQTINPNEIESIRKKFTIAGTYYIILDSFGNNSSGSWTLDGQLICGPTSPPHNDLCVAATEIVCGSISISGSTQYATNNYGPPDSLAASFCTGRIAKGRDVVYRVTVSPGDSIALNYTTTTNGSIYIVRNCNDIVGTCVNGVDAAGPGGTELLRYRFDFSGVYYIILDSRDLDTFGNWTATGTFTCLNPPPPNDRCDNAVLVPCGNINWSGTSQLATNDYFFPIGQTQCTGYATDGRDIVYKFNAAAGDSIAINYLSSTDGSMYVVTDCADLQGTCKIGVDLTLDGEVESLRWRFPRTGTYYLILDSVELNTWGNWSATGSYSLCSTVDVGTGVGGAGLALRQIMPNPFSGSVALVIFVPVKSHNALQVYDLQGRLRRTLLDEEVSAGLHRITWDGKDDDGRLAGAGVYFARLSSAGHHAVKQMIFVR